MAQVDDFEIRNLPGPFGAEVIGFDMGRDWTEEGRARLRRAFDERGAFVFRDLDIDFAGQDRICRMLVGDESPTDPSKLHERRVSNRGDEDALAPNGRLLYHADAMWHPEQHRIVSLYGEMVEAGAGRTMLTDSAHAWKSLPEEMRERLRGKQAWHESGQVYHRGGADLARPQRTKEYSCIKPVPLIHPDTGEELLFVSQQMTHYFVGMERDESEALLMQLFDHLYDDDIVYVHDWREHDLLVFDNIRMQHSRENVEKDGPTRVLRKAIAPMGKMKAETPVYKS
ncbi:taurine dioxygenase [Novosphingobium sp. CF614]|nr:taurine dioxygenase [Novosphingobium sp. CF614]